MHRSIEKIYKILKQEAELGFTNQAVVGGLEKLKDSWIGEARAEGVSEDAIQKISKHLETYSSLISTERQQVIKQIGHLLDIPGLKHLATSKSNTNQSTFAVSNKSFTDEVITQPLPENRVHKKNAQPPAAFADALNGPVTSIRGIGQKQAQLIAKLGLNTIKDLIYFFPRRYDDYSKLKFIKDLKTGDQVSIVAWVKSIKSFTTRSNKKVIEVIVSDDTGTIQLLWFNQAYQLRYLRENMFLSISGKIEQYMGHMVIYHPDYEEIDKQQLNTKRIVPVYPLTARLSQRWLRRIIYNAINDWAPKIPEFLTEYILADADLMDHSTAIKEIHFPENSTNLKKARHRLAFDEIFLMQLGVLRQKFDWARQNARRFPVDDHWLDQEITKLPYELTNAQVKVLTEITKDLNSGRPMNRLLQGDVGSGKTIIAALGLMMVIQHGAQGAFMAPTSILAEQHHASLRKLLVDPSGQGNGLKNSELRLLIGDTPPQAKQEIRAGLADGSIKLVIGTHALIEDPVTFKNLQFAVIDEQHRFGVSQRAALRDKGENPHLLVMTATPIPRSLALTIYGDLDVSVMDEIPAGRQPIETYILKPTERERVYSLIRSQVKEGHQAFIIYPLVEQGENEDSLAAVEEHARLQNEVFKNLRVALVHGRLRPDEKESVMRKFRDHEFDILVSTTVIEVGVDIPNATVMLIENANRFGLAQLHQLRGRVGRGAEKSYCILTPETNDAADNERLQVMKTTNDGFILAEHDLEQRGPGEFLGKRQSGFAVLRLANLTDVRLIEKARKYAIQVFENDPTLAASEHQYMLKAIQDFWPSAEGGEIS